ncbi:MAG TPA: histidine kinase dimerization/phosphoacceptor domain -containing protein [Azospirillum sp.]|nr:histidine kinase dimerization/phosphoacceptor domain -containing protein [Azospirillum sp.]
MSPFLNASNAGVSDGWQLAFLLAAMEQAPVAMAIIEGTEHRHTYVNAAYRTLPAATPPARGVPLVDCFPDLAPSVYVPRLEKVYRTGRPARASEVALASVTTGERRVCDIDFVPLCNPDGGRAVLITVQDVSANVAALAEKEGLLREVNHRVKNSLQLVSSLLTLQALSNRDPEMRRQLQEACGRVGTVAQVHQRLYQNDKCRDVAFGHYLRDLCRELTGSLSAPSQGRSILVDTDDVNLPVDSVIPLALVVNELVTNATKYAYADGQPGNVEVGFHVLSDGQKRLIVVDHGRGLPPGYDVARADTLGMKVVRAFVGQLKGRFRAEPNSPGTRFVIELPA